MLPVISVNTFRDTIEPSKSIRFKLPENPTTINKKPFCSNKNCLLESPDEFHFPGITPFTQYFVPPNKLSWSTQVFISLSSTLNATDELATESAKLSILFSIVSWLVYPSTKDNDSLR